jgi:hypothetical protein
MTHRKGLDDVRKLQQLYGGFYSAHVTVRKKKAIVCMCIHIHICFYLDFCVYLLIFITICGRRAAGKGRISLLFSFSQCVSMQFFFASVVLQSEALHIIKVLQTGEENGKTSKREKQASDNKYPKIQGERNSVWKC